MLTPSQFHPYQIRGVQFILDHPNAMLWEGMGLGKTAQSLTAVSELLDRWKITGALVIAPKRIIQSVWRQESKVWSHLGHLTFSLVHGTPVQRETALRRHADIHLVNYENLPWLVTKLEQFWLSKGKYPPFQMLILDEVTKVKNATAQRTLALTKVLPYFTRRVGLTGEPAANGYKDLHGQFLCVDGGQRLGTSKTAYLDAFFRPAGYGGFDWSITESGKKRIQDRIADITLELSAEEYLDLPPVTYNTITVDLPPKARKIYDELERDLFATLDSGADLEVMNEASKINKLVQVASGAAYLTPSGPWEEIHTEKLEALSDACEEASGRPLLLGYGYRHEATRIKKAFPYNLGTGTGAVFLSSKLSEGALNQTLDLWAQDKVQLLCGHPASMGHGLNLQSSSANSVIWFSLPWSLELYHQMNARLIGGHRRRGASFVHHIIARDTVDELIYETLQTKHVTQESLKTAIRNYREKRGM